MRIERNITESGSSGTPDTPDLSRPDANAEPLADALKTVQMNAVFSRAAMFILKWTVRPIFVWPFKLLKLAFIGYASTPRATHAERMSEEQLRKLRRGDI